MLPSIAASSSGHWNQDGSRRWQRSIAAVGVEPQPDEDVAAEALDQRQALAGVRRVAELGADRARRQPLEDLLDQREALLDLADADPDARIDVALVEHRHLEGELVVGRIGQALPRIEGAARGAADIAAGAELPRQRRREMPVVDGAVLQRGGVVVELDQLGKRAADLGEQRRRSPPTPSAARSRATPPGTMRSIISRWPKQASAARSTRSRSMPQWACISAKDGVVADGADVAEMVGEALQLGHQRAQPDARAAATSTPSAASTARAKASA